MASTVQLPNLARWRRWSLGVGLIALLLSVATTWTNSPQLCRPYLAAYLFYFGLALGSMTVLMVYHLTGGAWGFLIRRILEAGTRTFPLVAVGFLPIALGIGKIYPWVGPEPDASGAAARHAQIYLNPDFFWLRAAFFFSVWLLVAGLLNHWSRKQDETRNPYLAVRLRTLSGLGLVSVGVGLNFISTDWVMSLQPPFHSTIFGPLMASCHLLSALSLGIIFLAWLKDEPLLAQTVSADSFNDLGSLLFSFVIVWSYMVWFQFMLIWIANLPVDIIWYLPRSTEGWHVVSLLLLVFAFIIPLFSLLLRRVKRDIRYLARVAGLILTMQLFYDFYLVLPALAPPEPANPWLAFGLAIGLGGVWLACLLWQLGQRPLLPAYDFNQNETLRLRHKHDQELPSEKVLSHG